MNIKCKHWNNEGEFMRGSCALGLYKGRPNFFNCVNECKKCDTSREELQAYRSNKAKKAKHAEQDKERDEAFKDLKPSMISLLKHLGKDGLTIAKHYKKTGKLYADGFVQGERQQICRTCPHNVNDRCSQCGCGVSGVLWNKTKYAVLSCPVGNW